MSVWYQKHQALAGQSLPPSTFFERLAIAGWNFWFYLGKALLPLHLSVVYFRWKPDITTVTAYLPDLLVVAIFVLCWCFRHSWGRHALLALGCFVIALFPALGFVDAQFLVKFQVSDHLEYLPLIAPLALVAAWLASVLGRKTFTLAAVVLMLILSGYTMQRAQVFSTQENLMRDTLEKNPLAWDAHNDLGVILAERKDFAGAEEHFTAALKSNPDNDEASLNLAQLLILQGRFEEAREHLATALKRNPANSDFHEKLADALSELGRPQEAIIQLKLALRLMTQKPHSQTRLALAGLLYATGAYREAVDQYHEILSVKPDLTEPLNNLAWILATCPDETLRNGSKAVEYAEYACLITKFKDPHTVGTLAAAYAEAGRFPEAVVTADFAIRLATATHEMQFASINEQLLMYYRAGKPWHEQPASNFSP
jgi:Flp pilus assembly protein TadD